MEFREVVNELGTNSKVNENLEVKIHDYNLKNYSKKTKYPHISNIYRYFYFGCLSLVVVVVFAMFLSNYLADGLETRFKLIEDLCVKNNSARICKEPFRTHTLEKEKSDTIKVIFLFCFSIFTFILTHIINSFIDSKEKIKKRLSVISVLESDANDTLEGYGFGVESLVLFRDMLVDNKGRLVKNWKEQLSSSFCVEIDEAIIKYIKSYNQKELEQNQFVEHCPLIYLFGDYIGRGIILDVGFWVLDVQVTKFYVDMVSCDDSVKAEESSLYGERFTKMVTVTKNFPRFISGVIALRNQIVEHLEKTIEFRLALNSKEHYIYLEESTIKEDLCSQLGKPIEVSYREVYKEHAKIKGGGDYPILEPVLDHDKP